MQHVYPQVVTHQLQVERGTESSLITDLHSTTVSRWLNISVLLMLGIQDDDYYYFHLLYH